MLLAAYACALSCAFVVTLYETSVKEPAPGTCANNRTIHLIRHAQGWHNIDELEAEAAFKAGAASWHGLDLRDQKHIALREEFGIAWTLLEQVSGRKYHDPHLTPAGREQAYALRSQLRGDPTFALDAVALSPMRRTIETALLGLPQLEGASTAFAWAHDHDPPRPPPMVANDLLRERCAHFMPDSRLSRTELARQYGGLGANATIDFSQVEEDDTPFLEGKERHEPEIGSPMLASRALLALRWLASLPRGYERIAVVSHCHFLGAITGLYPESVRQAKFSNAERRTAIMCVGDDDDDGTVKPLAARVAPMGGVAQRGAES